MEGPTLRDFRSSANIIMPRKMVEKCFIIVDTHPYLPLRVHLFTAIRQIW